MLVHPVRCPCPSLSRCNSLLGVSPTFIVAPAASWCCLRRRSLQLVLLAICDHYQRVSSGVQIPEAAGRSTSLGLNRAVGVLFGVQHGHIAEIFTSFELLLTPEAGGGLAIDEQFVTEQRKISMSLQ